MTRPVGHDESVEVDAQQGQVADHVEDLMPGAFVGVAQFVADDAVAAEEQEVGGIGSHADPGGPQRVRLGLQEESAAGGQLAAEGFRGEADAVALGADRCLAAVIEMIGEHQAAGRGGRVDREDGVALSDADRILHDEGLAHPVLLEDPGAVEGLDERLARAVATGTLARVDLDDRIVDLEAGQRGHDVLDHLDARAVAADRRATLRRRDRIDPRGDRRPTRQVGATEDDPGVGHGRVEANRDVGAMEEADSAHLRRAGDRTLSAGWL